MTRTLTTCALPTAPSDCPPPPGDAAADLVLVSRALRGEALARGLLASRMLCIPGQVRIRLRRHGILAAEDEVADISQEIFAAIWERLERYRGDSPLEGWAYGFVARITLAAMRNHSRRNALRCDEDVAELAEKKVSAVEGTSEVMASLLPHLRPQDERIIQLRYFDGLNYSGIADRLSCTERAARARFQRAMDRLRELARDRGVQPS